MKLDAALGDKVGSGLNSERGTILGAPIRSIIGAYLGIILAKDSAQN